MIMTNIDFNKDRTKRLDNYTSSYHGNPYEFGYTVRKGDIFWAELKSNEDTIGSEQGQQNKIRPVVVLQNNFGNTSGRTTIVAKITSAEHNKKCLPTNQYLKADSGNGLTKDSIILLNQIETIDKSRFVDKMGSITPEQLNELNKKLLISFGVDILYL